MRHPVRRRGQNFAHARHARPRVAQYLPTRGCDFVTVAYPPGHGATCRESRSPPAIDTGLTDAERETILAVIAKGAYAAITFAAEDLDALYEQLEAAGAEVVQEPTDQDYGVRDCAFRDPSGNLVRINQL